MTGILSPNAMTAASPLLRFALACACVCSCAAASGTDATLPGAQAIDAAEDVAGTSQADWSQAWLQWVASFPRYASPTTDTTGALCEAKQDGDVWFLAASNGTAAVQRTCTIPPGKTLFVPLASTTEARSGNREADCPAMARIAAQSIEVNVDQLSLVVDGVPLPDLRSHRLATSGCYSPGLRQMPRTTVPTTVGNGYYVMLRPLAPGKHTLSFGARFGDARLSTTYTLDVR
jgi:hypothetical protein